MTLWLSKPLIMGLWVMLRRIIGFSAFGFQCTPSAETSAYSPRLMPPTPL